MLYFSKIRIISILIFTSIFFYLTISNFIKYDDSFISKKINLGLDLQGGSYLLLEIDNSPVITQKLQNKLSTLRKYFKDNNIYFSNLKIESNNTIAFSTNEDFVDDLQALFEDKESKLNPYYPRFKSHEFELFVENNNFNLKFSKYGIIELKKNLSSRSFRSC